MGRCAVHWGVLKTRTKCIALVPSLHKHSYAAPPCPPTQHAPHQSYELVRDQAHGKAHVAEDGEAYLGGGQEDHGRVKPTPSGWKVGTREGSFLASRCAAHASARSTYCSRVTNACQTTRAVSSAEPTTYLPVVSRAIAPALAVLPQVGDQLSRLLITCFANMEIVVWHRGCGRWGCIITYEHDCSGGLLDRIGKAASCSASPLLTFFDLSDTGHMIQVQRCGSNEAKRTRVSSPA